MFMNRYFFIVILVIFTIIATGCPGIGKADKLAADQAISKAKEMYGDKIKDIKIYRDKLEIAFQKELSNPEKSQIFMDAARMWWAGYPSGKKPRYKLYCWAYDDVISDDTEIGSMNMKKGMGEEPKVEGEPGIYKLRDVK